MKIIEEIKKPVEKELSEFEDKLKTFNKSEVRLINIITKYFFSTKGKQIRPLLVLLFSGLNGCINEKTYRAAILIELLHSATLIHDDVVDDATYRRNLFTINALWKNKIAVLYGDYLLSRGMLVSLENNDYTLLKIVSKAVREMSEGELLQLEKSRKLNITEEIYFEIIRKKTATLIAACCATGTAAVTEDEKLINCAWQIGEKAGIAFQIKDDLMDFESNSSGKEKYIDLKERKITLPFIYLLNKSSYFEKRNWLSVIKKSNPNSQKISELIEAMNKCGAFSYTKEKMNHFAKEALEMLKNNFCENNVYRESLEKLIIFMIERNI